jgi:NAD(P)-dependent dehydrogenase (short-subunit alcohol dehydrogenase family)
MGQAIARRMGSGTELVLADYRAAALEGLAEQMRGDGFSVHRQQVDVRSHASVAAVAATAKRLGKVTRLVCTAGIAPVHAKSDEILAVNLLGASYVIEEFGEVIAEGGTGVIISSSAGHHFPGKLSDDELLSLSTVPAASLPELSAFEAARQLNSAAAYGFAKHICRLRTQAAAASLWADRGARLNSISPGVTATPMGQASLTGEYGPLVAGLVAASPVKRAGTAEEIANVVEFLLGPAATFVVGSDLVVDGGTLAAIKTGRFKASL